MWQLILAITVAGLSVKVLAYLPCTNYRSSPYSHNINMIAIQRPLFQRHANVMARFLSEVAADGEAPVKKVKKMKVKRYDIVPLTLYRVQPKLPVRLRNRDDQMALGRSSFDLKVKDGLVHPAVGDEFIGPNGMSLRPASDFMKNLVENFEGNPIIYTLIPGLQLPESFVLLYEHTDHFSLQVSRPMPLDEFNELATEFLKTLPAQTKEQFVAAMEDEDDFDN